MAHNERNAGFTLIELMIVVAVIATIATMGLPKLMSARLAANESAAISTLRRISAAQAQFQSCQGVDSNADGAGEYGYFGELTGMAGLREYDTSTHLPTVGTTLFKPTILSAPFGFVDTDAAGDGVVLRSGYYYKMFLPGATSGGVTAGIPESGGATGGATSGTEPNPNNCAILWCCYAWPIEAGKSGNRVFFVNQDGDILQYGNKTGDYSGPTSAPAFDAAYSDASPSDMEASLGINGATPNDGFAWTVLE